MSAPTRERLAELATIDSPLLPINGRGVLTVGELRWLLAQAKRLAGSEEKANEHKDR
jgi:hypothetical protein